MKANLIIIDTECNTWDAYEDIYSNLQQIFNLSTVEFQNTTVFSDFEAICANLGKFLGRFTVIVSSDIGGLGYTEIDKILCGYYNTTSNKYNDCVYYMSSAGICVVVPPNTTMQGLSNEFFVDKLHLHPACAFMQLFGLEKIDVKKLFFEIPNSSNFDISIYAKDKICQLSISQKNNLPKAVLDEFMRNLYLQFQNHWFADTNGSMLQELGEILSIRKIRIGVADALTGGEFVDYLCQDTDLVDNYINKTYVINQRNDYQYELGISQEFLDSHPLNGVDMAYEMSAVMMENNVADVVISLCGDDYNWFVSIGDSQVIHVYKYTNQNAKKNIMKIICNQAIFKLLQKLTKNQLYFLENDV